MVISCAAFIAITALSSVFVSAIAGLFMMAGAPGMGTMMNQLAGGYSSVCGPVDARRQNGPKELSHTDSKARQFSPLLGYLSS